MRTEHDSQAILDFALDAANADEADALFISHDQNITRFAGSNVHQNMSGECAELTLRVIVGDAMGVASTTVFERDEIARTAALAREAARHADALQNFSGLYRGHEPAPALRTFDACVAAMPPAEKARALRAMFDRGRERNLAFAGVYGTGAASYACANTHGVRRFCTTTTASASVIALGAGASGYAAAVSRGPIDLIALGDEAIVKATLAAGAEAKLPAGAYDVILEPAAVAEVFEWLDMIAFTGTAFEDGSSFFVGNIGKQLLGANLTVADDAVDDALLPFPFDFDGLPKRRVPLIERGVIRTPVVDKIYADRLRLPPTASGWSLGGSEHGHALHLAVDAGEATRDELIASSREAIWVTRFNYVNGLLEPKNALMTGMTRDGTFLIRDGEVAARLPNLRWTQSIVEAFSRIEALTRDRRRVAAWYNEVGGMLLPAMKIAGWNFG